MFAVRQYSLAGSLVLLSLLACERTQPVEPFAVEASTAAAGPKVNAPSNTSAVSVSESQIDVRWQDNSADESGFEIHRSAGGPGGPFTLLASTAANIASYSDAGLPPATQYCYKVRAFRRAGSVTKYSQFSSVACATTPPPPPSQPPAAPSQLSGLDSPSSISLSWLDNSTDEDGFRIERCVGEMLTCGAADFVVIGTTAASPYNWAGYGDADVQEGTAYTYRVRAYNRAGDSEPSNVVSVYHCIWGVSEEGWYMCMG